MTTLKYISLDDWIHNLNNTMKLPYTKIVNNRIEYIDKTPYGAICAIIEGTYERYVRVSFWNPDFGTTNVDIAIDHEYNAETENAEELVNEAIRRKKSDLDDSRKASSDRTIK